MTVNRTTLLDLPLPVTGTGSGTWGDTTNNGLSQYTDIAIAGMNSLTSANFTAGALTIANTLGDSLATNIAAGSAQFSTIKVSSLAQNSTITAPGNSGTPPVYSGRSYRIINADATYSLTIKASGQTGVTLLPGQTAVVAFNGTDYVVVGTVGAGSTTDNTVPRFDGTTGKILQSSGITIDDSNNVSGVAQLNITTLDATNIEVTNIKAKDGTAAASIADSTGVISVTANPVLSGGTANGVAYLNASKVLTTGSALTFDGTVLANKNNIAALSGTNSSDIYFAVGNAVSSSNSGFFGWRYNSGSPYVYLEPYAQGIPARLGGSEIQFQIANGEQMRLTSTGLGIGQSSPSGKLDVAGDAGVYVRPTGASGTYLQFTAGAANGNTNIIAGANSGGYPPIVFQTGGGEKMRLDSSGNLGIGTSSPNAKVDINGSITVTADSGTNNTWNGLTFRYIPVLNSGFLQSLAVSSGSVTGGKELSIDGSEVVFRTISGGSFTEGMRLTSTGLGIGTSSPSYKLDVVGSAARLSYNTAGGPTLLLNNTSGSSFKSQITLAAGGTAKFSFGLDATGAGANNLFWYDEAAAATRMTLDSSGNLGIGTSSPSTRLHVKSSGGVGTSATFETDAPSSAINFVNTGSTTNAYLGSTGTALYFATNDTERARIDSSGNLLVGTTSAPSTWKATVYNGTDDGIAGRVANSGNWPFVSHNQATSGDNGFVIFGTEASFTTRGSIDYNRAGGLTRYNTTSDYRAKDIIGSVQNTGATIDALKVYEGKMKGATQSRPMLVAHEAQEHAPYAVSGVKDEVNEDGTPKFQQMDVSSLVPLLLAEIQSLRARVAALESN